LINRCALNYQRTYARGISVKGRCRDASSGTHRAILNIQAVMGDREYREVAATIENFNLSIVDQSSPQRTHSS
jgi:hypothetical protein